MRGRGAERPGLKARQTPRLESPGGPVWQPLPHGALAPLSTGERPPQLPPLAPATLDLGPHWLRAGGLWKESRVLMSASQSTALAEFPRL